MSRENNVTKQIVMSLIIVMIYSTLLTIMIANNHKQETIEVIELKDFKSHSNNTCELCEVIITKEEVRLKEEQKIKAELAKKQRMKQYIVYNDKYKIKQTDVKQIIKNGIATGYDLSVRCCGKKVGSYGYGLTASGFDLNNLSYEEAMAIAVDKNVIPLGSYVYLKFNDEYHKKYNGIYYACDTGGAVKGNKIDVFLGDHRSNQVSQEALDFAKTNCTIYVLGDDYGK